MINEETQKVVDLMSKVELMADEILTDRAQIVQLEKRKNGNREALRYELQTNGSFISAKFLCYRSLKTSENKKEWLCVGKLFMRLPKESVKSILESGKIGDFFLQILPLVIY